MDLVYYGNGSRLDYDFVVAAGADPLAIALTFLCARSVSADKAGTSGVATSRRHEEGNRGAVRGQEQNEVGVELDHYDAGAALVIDPVLIYYNFV